MFFIAFPSQVNCLPTNEGTENKNKNDNQHEDQPVNEGKNEIEDPSGEYDGDLRYLEDLLPDPIIPMLVKSEGMSGFLKGIDSAKGIVQTDDTFGPTDELDDVGLTAVRQKHNN